MTEAAKRFIRQVIYISPLVFTIKTNLINAELRNDGVPGECKTEDYELIRCPRVDRA